MKVAVVTTMHGPQDDRIYYKQVLSLAKHMEVVVIAPDDDEELDWPQGIRYQPIRRRLGLAGRLCSLVEASLQVRRVRPDVCHLHDLDLVLAIPLIRLISRAKVIYDSHEAYPDQFRSNERVPQWLRSSVAKIVDIVEKGFVRLASHVIAADEPTRNTFVATGVASTTIFNYPRLSIFETSETILADEAAKYANRLPIIYQGTTSADRGVFQMVDALAIIRKTEPRVLLRLIGLKHGHLRDQVEAAVRHRGLTEHIEITDWMQHTALAYAMKNSVVGLIPWQPTEKHKKNIPIKLFEYMACEIPVVAADIPPIAYYLEQVNAGILYDSTRPQELARCVLKILADPEGARLMGVNGSHAVHERWNWAKMETALLEVYASLGATISADSNE